EWQFVADVSFYHMRKIVAGERVRRYPDVVEILNTRVVAVPFLLRRVGIALLSRPGVTHVHRQASSSALDYVEDHGVVIALPQRKAHINAVPSADNSKRGSYVDNRTAANFSHVRQRRPRGENPGN